MTRRAGADALLELSGVSVSYGPIVALTDVNLVIPEGSIVCLLGSNGAGKSTTLKAISGLVRPRAGSSVRFSGEEMKRSQPAQRLHLGIAHCPEQRRVFTQLTVHENLVVAGHSLGRKEMQEGVEHSLDLFPSLKSRLKAYGATLSGGEQQMLAVARSLITRPKLLLLDEPSLGLAPIVTGELFETFTRINAGGTTILLVEQSVTRALAISTYAYLLRNGKVVLEGKADVVAKNEQLSEAYLVG